MATLGILHPGSMGAALAANAVEAGNTVLWASQGRSDPTAVRARRAGATDVGSVASLCERSAVVLSICPPAAAEAVAREVAATGFSGCYVDANAIAPGRMRAVADTLHGAGATVVDGGVIGRPPRERGTTRLYLAGEGAQQVAKLFAAGPVEVTVLERPIGTASALKMAYGASTKGAVALSSLCLAMAKQHGVLDELAAEWDRVDPDATAGARRRVAAGVPKAWRWVGEMHEVADTAVDSGLPDGFHRSAAALFERWAQHRDVDVDIDVAIAELPRR